jgi:hypothetical protein
MKTLAFYQDRSDEEIAAEIRTLAGESG